MTGLLRLRFQSVAAGIIIYVFFYLLISLYMNAVIPGHPRNAVAAALIGFLVYFPFLAAGYNTALRSHPAGVFNSVLVGMIAGVVTVSYVFLQGGVAVEYAVTAELFGETAAGLVICSLGGVLGEAKRHYIKKDPD